MSVVETIKDKCKRCYSCIRNCPAKAIRVEEGQAEVIAERCIGCGTCVRVCAQNAKRIESGIEHTALLPFLAPIASPMIATARLIKRTINPNAKIVFIGPCIAKKKEKVDPAVSNLVDEVLTYKELKDIIANYVRSMIENDPQSVANMRFKQLSNVDMSRQFTNENIILPEPSEEQIREVLAQINKAKPEHELNCGSCGYHTCREKAIAVFQGLAEVEMCLPYLIERMEKANQELLNLFINAAQAMDNGGQLTVSAYKAGENGFVAIDVIDTGCGIPKENLSKIFDPFFSTKIDKRGTGLGLAMVYQIITRHGGKTQVESKVGVGTRFTIKLRTHLQNPEGQCHVY